jgi:hypothetical protein
MSSSLEFWHHHGGVSVPNLDESIKPGTRDVLGFEVAERFKIPAIPAEVAMLRNGSLCTWSYSSGGGPALPAERREPDTDCIPTATSTCHSR